MGVWMFQRFFKVGMGDGKRAVHHTPTTETEGKFVLDVAPKGGRKPFAQYTLLEDGTIDLWHTYTPPSYRGQGCAAECCIALYEWAVQSGQKVKPSCSYVRDNFLANHPQYQKQSKL